MQSTVKYLFEAELKYNKYGRDKFFQSQFDNASNLYSKDLKAHFSCVNAVEFSNSGQYMASAGDDKRVLVWNVNENIYSKETTTKMVMNTLHHSNIFSLAWDNEDRKIFSGANDHQLIVHDVETREICDIFLHENAVLCIAVHPQQSHVFATACESGQISLYDLRLSNSDPIILASSDCNIARDYNTAYESTDSSSSSSNSSNHSVSTRGGAFQSCHFNPVNGNLIAVANEITGVSLIDIRMKSTLLRYESQSDNDTNRSSSNQNVMSVRFNKYGTQLAALRNSLRPVIYNVNNLSPIFQFDSDGFKNSCTLKSCCFAGNSDQYLVTGSDDSNVYCWKIPSAVNDSFDSTTTLVSEAHLSLKGHRSIVNQCRYNSRYHLLATSGVEKIVKIWSTYSLPGGSAFGGLLGRKEEYAPKRESFSLNGLSRSSNLNEVQITENADLTEASSVGDQIGHLIDESLEEDRAMIAFFDSQLRRQQRLNEGASSESVSTSAKKKKLRRLLSTVSNPTNFSDNEEVSTNNLNRIQWNQSVSNDESFNADLSDNDRASDTSSSTSGSSDLSEELSSSESIEDAFNKSNFKKAFKSVSRKKSSKRKLIPLRDRLRNLRHRRTMNITEQSDFKSVIDSLNAYDSPESTGQATTSKFFNNKPGFAQSIKVNKELLDNTCGTDACDNKPGTSRSLTKNLSLENLKEQKRRIELNNDADEQIKNGNLGADDFTEEIVFKKFKRKSNEIKRPSPDKEESSSE